MKEVKLDNSAFSHEFLLSYRAESIYHYLISYLGEYRLKIPQYTYQLNLTKGQLVDLIEKRSLVEQGNNAIKRRQLENKSTNREEAELIGLHKLESELKFSKLGDIIIWCSPPGLKTDGYGEYGFIYLGQVIDEDMFGNKKLLMNALRVEQPTFIQFNNWLKKFGTEVEYITAEEFLANPVIFSSNGISPKIETYIQELPYYFNFSIDNEKNERNQRLWQLMKKINPYIEMYIQAIKNSNFVQAKEIFNTIENLAVAFENSEFNLLNQLPYMPTFQVIEAFKYTPPPVAGSCGATSSVSQFNLSSQNIFSKLGIICLELKEGERYPDYECPHCHSQIQGELKNDKSSWKTHCPNCGASLNCKN